MYAYAMGELVHHHRRAGYFYFRGGFYCSSGGKGLCSHTSYCPNHRLGQLHHRPNGKWPNQGLRRQHRGCFNGRGILGINLSSVHGIGFGHSNLGCSTGHSHWPACSPSFISPCVHVYLRWLPQNFPAS